MNLYDLIHMSDKTNMSIPGSSTVSTSMTGLLDPNYGYRNDGTKKSGGYLGELKNKKGGFSTELSIGVDIDGKQMEIPLIVPSQSKQDLDMILSGGKIPHSAIRNAIDHARQRIGSGLDVFAMPSESPASVSISDLIKYK